MRVDLVQQTGPSPLWNGARRASSEFSRSSGRRCADTKGVSVVISSQTGGSGAPETTDDQPRSGGPSRELHNIIGERWQPQAWCRSRVMGHPLDPDPVELLDRRAAGLTESFGPLQKQAFGRRAREGESVTRPSLGALVARLQPFYLGTSRSSASTRRSAENFLCSHLVGAHAHDGGVEGLAPVRAQERQRARVGEDAAVGGHEVVATGHGGHADHRLVEGDRAR